MEREEGGGGQEEDDDDVLIFFFIYKFDNCFYLHSKLVQLNVLYKQRKKCNIRIVEQFCACRIYKI